MNKVLTVMAAAATVITITVGLGTIWGWIDGPKSSLEGEFIFGIYQEPTSISDVVTDLGNTLLRLDRTIVDELSENDFLLPSVASYQVSAVIRSVTDNLDDQHSALLQRNRFGGYLVGAVTNSGSTTLENVRIYLPDVLEAEFLLDGDTRSVREEYGTVPVLVIGTLPPAAKVTVSAWTSLEAVSRFNTKEIRLAHKDGYGDISIKIPTGQLGQWVDRIGPIGFGLFAGLITILSALFIVESVSRRNRNKN